MSKAAASSLTVLNEGPALERMVGERALPSGVVDGLYVHVPFCFHKCHYCDFYSITRQSPERMAAFVDRVLAEARSWCLAGMEVGRARTVFFGGGTPSLLPREEMTRLIGGVREVLGLGGVDEWTVECNPATVDDAYLSALREAGVDRISFGAQSFDRADLAALERHHDPEAVPAGVEAARRAGVSRVSLDLIYAVPGQSLESWVTTLRAALALGTDHLSAYILTYEENTPLAVKKRLGKVRPAAEELELEMLRTTRAMLGEAGLPAYEISNYARGGSECRHNLMYWHGGNYLGLGPSAASHLSGWRWKNRPHLGEWEAAVDSGRPGAVAVEVEHLAPERRQAELAYLMLRLREGVNVARFERKTGVDPRVRFAGAIDKLKATGTLVVDEESIRLTERGVEVADAVAAEFLAD